jgi:hypothetical protein
MRVGLRAFGLTVTVLFLASCSDDMPTATPGDVAPEPAFSAQPGHQSMADLARAVPGFGGLYVEADGTPTVWMRNSNARVAAPAIQAFLRRQGFDVSNVRTRSADFEWQELESWFDAASNALFEVPGVVFVDLDESRNRVTIGVEAAHVTGRARAAL